MHLHVYNFRTVYKRVYLYLALFTNKSSSKDIHIHKWYYINMEKTEDCPKFPFMLTPHCTHLKQELKLMIDTKIRIAIDNISRTISRSAGPYNSLRMIGNRSQTTVTFLYIQE